MTFPGVAHARVFAWVFALLNVVALLCLPLLQTNDDYRLLLKTDTSRFERYLDYRTSFGTQEQDVIVVLQGGAFGVATLRMLQRASETLPSVDVVQSVRSVWDIPWVQRNKAALLDGDDVLLRELAEKLQSPTYVPANLLSTAGNTTLINITLKQVVIDSTRALPAVITQVRTILDQMMVAGFNYHLAGYPALRAEVKTQTDRDAMLFGGLSILFALVVATIMLRRFPLVSIAMLVPVSSVICTLGAMAALEVHINLLNQVVVALVLVIIFADLMHVIRHLKTEQSRGASVTAAVSSTYTMVIPACLMTTVTTAAGFGSLLLSDSALIRQFGWVSAMAIVIGFILLLLALPWLAGLVYRFDRAVYKERITFSPINVKYDHRLISGAVVLGVAMLWVSLQVRAEYRLGENLPDHSDVSIAMAVADREVGGLIPYSIMLQWPDTVKFRQQMSDIRKVQQALREQTELRWMSIIDLMRFSSGFNSTSKFEMLPDSARERLFDSDNSRALLVTQLRSMSSAELQLVSDRVLEIVDALTAELKVSDVDDAGLLPLVSNVGHQITSDLLKSLSGTLAVVSVLVFVLLRSVRLGLVLLVPNVVPLLAVVAVLVLSGNPLQLATVVVFSVCLGIVVDDSIHLIMRYRQYRQSGLAIEHAIDKALIQIGPTLIHTTLIICAGFSVLLFSNTPPVQAVGALSLIAVPAALLLDLLVLPALIRRFAPQN